MKIGKTVRGALAATLGGGMVLAMACVPAQAQDLNSLKGILGGGASPEAGSLQSSSLGNATGVLEYCIKNKYLSGDSASSVKDQLMGKLSGTSGQPAQKNDDYLSGAKGLLKTGDGGNVELGGSGLKEKITKQACDVVLSQAKNFL
jgi:hypothetical protein